jgi:site-specific DNA recombinase
VCYSLDRLSRDPVHGVIITQELEKHHVGLEAVTETVDSTEVGKLITYIRGFAAKLEAEKIKERSVRGRKACAHDLMRKLLGY